MPACLPDTMRRKHPSFSVSQILRNAEILTFPWAECVFDERAAGPRRFCSSPKRHGTCSLVRTDFSLVECLLPFLLSRPRADCKTKPPPAIYNARRQQIACPPNAGKRWKIKRLKITEIKSSHTEMPLLRPLFRQTQHHQHPHSHQALVAPQWTRIRRL